MKTETKHTPTRCKDCKWVDEADSIKETSFKGVEFCAKHNRAVNSHDELIKKCVSLLSTLYNYDWAVDRNRSDALAAIEDFVSRRDALHDAIAKAEGKV